MASNKCFDLFLLQREKGKTATFLFRKVPFYFSYRTLHEIQTHLNRMEITYWHVHIGQVVRSQVRHKSPYKWNVIFGRIESCYSYACDTIFSMELKSSKLLLSSMCQEDENDAILYRRSRGRNSELKNFRESHLGSSEEFGSFEP